MTVAAGPKQYSMSHTLAIAAQGTQDITRWLLGRRETLHVENVEDQPLYQKKDIDLLWTTVRQPQTPYAVEIKADNQAHRTKNFFFETHSCVETGTPGCFLYSEADLFFYYLVEIGLLYVLPLAETRTWFLSHQAKFRTRQTQTPLRYEGRVYTTQGAIVSMHTVCQAIPTIRRYILRQTV